uniref:Cilia- and flagella-associated protein HOATZ n=1 Tax=Phallusia mammillata TaxID=59560 RepID=A0A6F9D829_9ASCI|nr:UPF0722 protein C11orf88 homolog [Phallusia mammillata]CAB3226511.1 UPF0722 protein C11orf88 homolog [Phallusia mammillata]
MKTEHKSKKNANNKEDSPPPVTIFHGSNSDDIEHAKSFWRSLTLHPPLESRLVSADIRQRLRIAPAPDKATGNKKTTKDAEAFESALFLHKAHEKLIQDERVRYRTLSQQRESVLDLLHKQREQRIQKEMISKDFK